MFLTILSHEVHFKMYNVSAVEVGSLAHVGGSVPRCVLSM